MIITVQVIKTTIGGVEFYKPDYKKSYKLISYSEDKTTADIDTIGE